MKKTEAVTRRVRGRAVAAGRTLLLVAGLVSAVTQPVGAAPIISEVAGALGHGATLTISGSGFGSKPTAAPVKWDDMESRTVNNPSTIVSEGGYTDREPRGAWARTTADPTYYDIQYRAVGFRGMPAPHPRSTRFMAGATNNYRQVGGRGQTTYAWLRSRSGVNEYYCALSGGGNPNWFGSWPGVAILFMKGPDDGYLTKGVAGSLANRQWAWGDNDGLGWSTLYYRDDSGDPDVAGTVLWAGLGGQKAVYGGGNVGVTIDTGAAADRLYLQFYEGYDPHFPLDGAAGANEKILNYEGGTTIYSTLDYELNTPQVQVSNPYGIGYGMKNPLEGGKRCNPPTQTAGCFPSPLGAWVKREYFVDLDTDATFYAWSSAGRVLGTVRPVSPNNLTPVRAVTIGGYFCYTRAGSTGHNCIDNTQKDGHQNAFRYYDDIYVDNTYARVILANAANYDAATEIEPQVPVTWSDTVLTVKSNLGRFSGTGALYLFVFDANNEHNAIGYRVGSLGGPAAPRLHAP